METKPPWTIEQRAALDARDRALLERFLARDPAAERELVRRLDDMGRTVCDRLWPRLARDWGEFRGEMFELLARWREEGKLRLEEPLYFLAQRLVKQVGRKNALWAHRDQMALSFDKKGDAPRESTERLPEGEDRSWRGWLETQAQASIAAQSRFPDSEAALASKEAWAWVVSAVEQLPPAEQATFAAELAVARGEHETLAAALGVAEGTSYNRRSKMRAALVAFALATGATEMLERLRARLQPNPAED